MLNRTLLSSVMVAVLFVIGTSVSTHAEEKIFTFNIGNSVILGQDHGVRGPTFFDKMKQWGSRLLQDDSHDANSHRPPVVAPPAMTIQPPKPPTALEVRESHNTSVTPNQSPQQPRAGTATTNTAQPRMSMLTTTMPSNIVDEAVNEGNNSTFATMRTIRDMVFTPALEDAAQTTRKLYNSPTTTTLVPLAPSDFDNSVRNFTRDFENTPSPPQPLRNIDEGAVPQPTPVMSPSQQAIERIAQAEIPRPANRLTTSASPSLKFELEEPPSVVINQEITYRIRVQNVGDAHAEGVIVKTEIPSWLDVRHADTDNGKVTRVPREDGSGITDLVWEMNRINQGATNMLVLRSIPQQRRTIEFPITYDFHKPAIRARVEVQEPRLEMELIGSDDALWNEIVTYTLVVRNVGTGYAENVHLNLLQSSSEEGFLDFPEPLPPGGSQEVPIQIRAGREQEYIDLAVLATGAHDLKGEVKRRIRVLRPKLEILVQTLPLHFVDNTAEIAIRVRNVGSADADNVHINAELPLGAVYETSNEGGMPAILRQQNCVEWRGKSIAKGEMQTFTLACKPQREGECRVSVEASEPGGSLLVAGNGSFIAKAIVELELDVLKPSGPVELGQEAEYTVQLTNKGTKAAENVSVSLTFGKQLEPVAVKGGGADYDDGQVFFEKIPAILPKQTITLAVVARADQLGMAPIRAEVSGADIQLTKGLSSYIFSQSATVTASGQSQDEIFR